MTTAADLVNRALLEIGAQAQVTGVNPTFDATPYGNAAGILYSPAVNFLLRQQDWEFALVKAPLVLVGNSYPFAFSYVYPVDCQRIRQIYPTTWDLDDPQPITWSFDAQVLSGVETRLILTDVENAIIAYTTNELIEDQFDPVFQEALVRLLASEDAMGLAGRPDFAAKMLEWSGGIAADGGGKDS